MYMHMQTYIHMHTCADDLYHKEVQMQRPGPLSPLVLTPPLPQQQSARLQTYSPILAQVIVPLPLVHCLYFTTNAVRLLRVDI
jgi:hypothetical protein